MPTVTRLIRRAMLAVSLPAPIARDHTAALLCSLSIGLLFWSGFHFMVVLLRLPWVATRFPPVAIEIATALATIAVLRRGSLRTSGLIYLGGSWAVATWTILF